MNFINILKEVVKENPDKLALVCGSDKLTYNELDQLSSHIAGKIAKSGIKYQEYIVINASRGNKYVAAYLGILKAGCVVVPTVKDYPKERIDYIKNNCKASLVIDDDFFDDVDKYDEYMNLANDDENALLIYTSGSTGFPKGILHTVDSLAVTLYGKEVFELDDINFAASAPMSFIAFAVEYLSILALGGTIHILSDAVRKSIREIEKYFTINGINAAFIVPQILKLYKNNVKSLKLVIAASERLSDVYFEGLRIINTYGMTETYGMTVFDVDKKYANTPIGKPVNGNIITIDKKTNEIIARVPHKVTYFDDSDKLKYDGKYTTIPTGDYGHFDENGNLVYDQRLDWMVKINGQRVETKEIEETVKTLGKVDVIVKGFTDSSTYMVLYYISDEITETMIKDEIKKKMPAYMMPRFFVKMDKFPVNVNGKLAISELKSPNAKDYKKEYVAPKTENEKKLCKAFETVLKIKQVGINDDFISLGGDSIKVLEVVDNANIDGLTPDLLLSKGTPYEISLSITKNKTLIEHNEEIKDFYPLTDSQLGVYLECIQSEDPLIYNLPGFIKLPNSVDKDKFIEAVKAVINNHRAMRIAIKEMNGSFGMVDSKLEVMIEEKKVKDIEVEKKDFIKPFDFANGPLYHAEIVNDGKDNYFLIDVHHTIFDGTSLSIFVNEICDAYEGKKLDKEELTIFDMSEYLLNVKETEDYKNGESFFESKLSGVDVDSNIISDRITEDEYIGSTKKVTSLSNIDFDKLDSFVKKNNITENTLFLGAFAYTLAKFNGSKEALFASANNGRHDKRLKNAIGMFVKSLPLYFNIDESTCVTDYLLNIQEYFYETMSHDVVSFADAAIKYGVNTNITFVYQSTLFEGSTINGKNVSLVEIDKGTNSSDLTVMVIKNNNEFETSIDFRNSLYSDAIIDSFVDMYEMVINEMLEKNTLSDVLFVSNKCKAIIDDFNKNDNNYDLTKSVATLLEESFAKNPNKLAVCYKDKKLTYKELDEVTTNLAGELIERGIQKEDVVGILINKSEFMAICACGVTRSNAAYLPIDPSYPVERINLMLADSGAKLLISDDDLVGISTEFKGPIIKTSEIKSLKKYNKKLPVVSADSLFIMLYTSGSTGIPKGVMLEHGNLSETIQYSQEKFEYTPEAKQAAYASFGFDASMFDLYPILCSNGTLYIIPDEIRMDLPAIKEFYNTNGITHGFMTTQLGRQFMIQGGLTTLKKFSLGGEKLVPLNPPEGIDFYNIYGPTECSIYATIYKVDKKYKDIPIGKGLSNMKLYVADSIGRMLPIYATGELLITGPQVARGYLNRPEKNAEAFTSNPYDNDKKYERMYHTGDVVRFMPEGDVQFIGRKDAQVKIRGFRIELTEVEEVIRRFNGIKDATVAAFDNPAGGKFIAAYVVSNDTIDIKALNDFILSEKPAYMVPQVTLQIDAIPYNQNQKVNKRALPKPEVKSESADSNRPMTKLEERLVELIAKNVGFNISDVSLDLKSAGLTSLAAISLSTQIENEFGIEISVKDLLNNTSLLDVENLIVDNLMANGGSATPEVHEKLSCYPLSETQFGVYSECLMNPGSTMYNIPTIFKISKEVGANKLRDAFVKVINAHSSLKATISAGDNDEIYMYPHDDLEPIVDVMSGTTKECDEYAKTFVQAFDMTDRMYKVTIYEVENEIVVLMDFHHIIFDGTSIDVFMSDVDKVLMGSDIETEKYTMFDFAEDEKKIIASGKYKEAEEFYNKLMSGSQGCNNLDADLEKTDDSYQKTLTKKAVGLDVNEIKKFTEKMGITENIYFLSVMAFVLGKYTWSEDVCFSTVYNGRSSEKMFHMTGMFVKTLPVRASVDDDTNTQEFLKSMQDELFGSMSNDVYSFANISRKFKFNQDFMFIYQGEGFGGNKLGGYDITILPQEVGKAKRPITVNMQIEDGSYQYFIEYDSSYSEDAMSNLADTITEASKNLYKSNKLKDINITNDEALKIIDSFNETDFKIKMQSVNKMFEYQVTKNRDKIAVTANNESLTFNELNKLANHVAHNLIKLGVKKDTIIGMLMDRTKEVFITEHGILKSGGAFLPLVWDYPVQRIDYCLKDAGSPFVITTKAIMAKRPELIVKDAPYKILFIDDLIIGDNDENPNLDIPLDSLSYCIYTSGSTGNPKGVMIEHRNMCNYVTPNIKHPAVYYHTVDIACALSVTSISFDMSITERFVSLCNGVPIVMATQDEIYNPIDLAKTMIKNNAQSIVCTPSYLMSLLEIPDMRPAIANLKAYHVGGEAFPSTLISKLKALNPNSHVINGYGPTETAVSCTAGEVFENRKITIGRPEANVKNYVCDKSGHILPWGVQGELIIAGPGVGRGYINLPEKTKASFFEMNGMKAYHSGDLCRFMQNGEIEYFGRLDNQVKLRGLRVELDEIENVMLEYPGLKLSKVIVRNNGTEDYLAGFFTAEKQVDLDDLTKHLHSKLTAYMVPAVLMQLDKMPLTTNGKIDKKQLPEVEYIAKEREYVAPKNKLEELICAIYKEVLKLDNVSASDSFFEIGGTSLSATKVVMHLQNEGYTVVYKDVFSNPSAIALSKFISGDKEPEVVNDDISTYDYSKINELISNETLDNVNNIKKGNVSSVVLTGATGFLGIHVLNELITNTEAKVYCLIRKGDAESLETRMNGLLVYYFGKSFIDYFNKRIFMLEGDITKPDTLTQIEGLDANIVINCAACVKHFVDDDILDRINVGGVKNLIAVCEKTKKRLIQISTGSVAGEGDSSLNGVELHENELFINQDTTNDYVRTKFLAERAILESKINNNLDAKIIRVGNLMSRHVDGEFQINFITNGFMRMLKSFKTLKAFPTSNLCISAEFSPIDTTAKAIVAIAGSENEFSIFHAFNNHVINMGDVIYAMKNYGFDIDIVSDEKFGEILNEAKKDDSKADAILGVSAYSSSDKNPKHFIPANNRFTTEVLYRIGFKWGITDDDYLKNAIYQLDTLMFFD